MAATIWRTWATTHGRSVAVSVVVGLGAVGTAIWVQRPQPRYPLVRDFATIMGGLVERRLAVRANLSSNEAAAAEYDFFHWQWGGVDYTNTAPIYWTRGLVKEFQDINAGTFNVTHWTPYEGFVDLWGEEVAGPNVYDGREYARDSSGSLAWPPVSPADQFELQMDDGWWTNNISPVALAWVLTFPSKRLVGGVLVDAVTTNALPDYEWKPTLDLIGKTLSAQRWTQHAWRRDEGHNIRVFNGDRVGSSGMWQETEKSWPELVEMARADFQADEAPFPSVGTVIGHHKLSLGRGAAIEHGHYHYEATIQEQWSLNYRWSVEEEQYLPDFNPDSFAPTLSTDTIVAVYEAAVLSPVYPYYSEPSPAFTFYWDGNTTLSNRWLHMPARLTNEAGRVVYKPDAFQWGGSYVNELIPSGGGGITNHVWGWKLWASFVVVEWEFTCLTNRGDFWQ